MGSSSSITSGSLMRPRAIVSRRFMPPDSGSTSSLARSVELHELEQLGGPPPRLAVREVEVAPVDDEVLEDRQLHVERVLLGYDAEACADRASRAWRGPCPSTRERAVRDRRDAADHPHRARLAGAVGAQEAERLAPRDVEVDPVDGREVAEALRQAAGMDDRGVTGSVDTAPAMVQRFGAAAAPTPGAVPPSGTCARPLQTSPRTRPSGAARIIGPGDDAGAPPALRDEVEVPCEDIVLDAEAHAAPRVRVGDRAAGHGKDSPSYPSKRPWTTTTPASVVGPSSSARTTSQNQATSSASVQSQ